MKTANGWLAVAAFVFILLSVWGGSYLYIRHSRLVVTAIFDHWSDQDGNVIFVDGEIREIVYSRRSSLQTALYYLHRPLHLLDLRMHQKNSAEAVLR